jgi:hypothetical protein
MVATVVASIDPRRSRRVPPPYGRRREGALRKKLALLVAATMMLASMLAFASVASAATYSSATATATGPVQGVAHRGGQRSSYGLRQPQEVALAVAEPSAAFP